MPGALLKAAQAAPMVVGPTTTAPTRPTDPIPQYLIDEAKATQKEDFEAAKHLNFEPPNRIITMEELGLGGCGISPNAVSDPFPLFTEDAVKQIRAEVFSDESLEHCQFASTFCKNMVRGMGPARAPFTYDAWNSPELVSAISQVAGIDLVPSIDYEIANINISVGDSTTQIYNKDHFVEDTLPAFAWHFDSFPFVCVAMLSDCQGMVGGETALRTASGETLKVRGPTMGTAVVIQGRYIEHQALKALGGRERISMVTCFRPKSIDVRDETILTGVRPISFRSELYTQYTEYRLELLEERIRGKMKSEKLRVRRNDPFNTAEARQWLKEQRDFLDAMIDEMID